MAQFNRQQCVLFWSLPPTDQDIRNLNVSNVQTVMMPFWLAHNNRTVLAHLASLRKRLIFRIEEDTYYSDAAADAVARAYDDMAGIVGDAVVITGNEPEGEYDLRSGSPNWGNQSDAKHPSGAAQEHAFYAERLRVKLQGKGVKVVSPGWSCKRMTPDDPAQPGRGTWYRWTGDVYDRMDANGAHIYAHNWISGEDLTRYLWILGNEEERCHKPVWIIESGVRHAPDPVTRMNYYIDQMRHLEVSNHGANVEMYSFFVSTGNPDQGPGKPPAYPPEYVLRDEQAYANLGRFLAG